MVEAYSPRAEETPCQTFNSEASYVVKTCCLRLPIFNFLPLLVFDYRNLSLEPPFGLMTNGRSEPLTGLFKSLPPALVVRHKTHYAYGLTGATAAVDVCAAKDI
jgi:hypothetical protein